MNIGVIFAGGVGKRMNSRVKPKQFIDVYGKPIIIHTLELFENHPEIDAMQLHVWKTGFLICRNCWKNLILRR